MLPIFDFPWIPALIPAFAMVTHPPHGITPFGRLHDYGEFGPHMTLDQGTQEGPASAQVGLLFLLRVLATTQQRSG